MIDRLTLFRALPNREAKLIAYTIFNMLLPIQQWVQTITVDNGLEFTEHFYVAHVLNTEFYCCTPFHSWQ